jgi:oxygen-independent coproporphyrinogen-3 oxidase
MSAFEPLSIYLHIPFCRSRCTYCDFITYAGLDNLIEPYVQAVIQEVTLIGDNLSPLAAHTLYLGGGTPSLLTPAQAEAVISACQLHLNLKAGSEITVEANPGTVDHEKLSAFRSVGINRLSLGVQSANERELKLFGRQHTFAEAKEAFQQARAAGFDNINVDLIYGIPDQSRQDWLRSLEAVLAWQPEHVSLYCLSVEEDTPLATRIKQKSLLPPDPDLAATFYDDARERLALAGFQQYELSNWARPGYECRHNQQYWLNKAYLGFGVGAHSSMYSVRYWNVAQIDEYIRRIEAVDRGKQVLCPPAMEGHESVSEQTAMSDTLILGLRLVRDGINKEDFRLRFGRSVDEVFGPAIAQLEQKGLLSYRDNVLTLTERAYLISNQVFVQLLLDES